MNEQLTLAPTEPAAPNLAAPVAAQGLQVPRVLGQVHGQLAGPSLVVIGGVHGNEPSGILALQRVLTELAPRAATLRGDFIALAGNREALALGQRYRARDLNRSWTEDRVAELIERPPGAPRLPEDHEQLELLSHLEEAFRGSRGPTFALDLHSTSAGGAPFVVLSDTLRNRAFAAVLPVPLVLGLEEELEGTLLSYLSDRGHVTLAFEAGQHHSPRSIDHAETAIWIALAYAGLLPDESRARPARLGDLLEASARDLPAVVEVRYRHAIQLGDEFRMLPGYTNFRPVEAAQVLAEDRRGPVRAPQDGLILMPLYQRLGDDGFFLVRGFSPLWLRLSAALRRLRADRFVHWLPGVRLHPARPATYTVNRHVARWYALEIFHLLGFRKVGETRHHLLVARRPHDLEADRQRP